MNAFLPPFAVDQQISDRSLASPMDDFIRKTREFAALWPASRQLSPRITAFANFLTEHLLFDDTASLRGAP
ncbi:LysR substrate-binding domain-containing protein [Pararhizobium qamdonense]|uniref:LysR substrate-binding domain-containing protein n=1 Tax=Pararhizobium qamdonense TaxID=3031126 RepID=UPI0038B2F46F